ncbi:uncharacterized protein CLUP02_12276 [Colletotrichum lupini]|uniref:Uncharacterized protein n=1 Tax=Colletotrichum lupini TaxID=145971 RepID=A0A9Q8T019_9PEZI|nr:uncharacterized protein CLUP02_12276 [Colletotrichum lupini]UQC86774.1 hypothetical protein CLUP02_12276 [Colletotrichum lupini]
MACRRFASLHNMAAAIRRIAGRGLRHRKGPGPGPREHHLETFQHPKYAEQKHQARHNRPHDECLDLRDFLVITRGDEIRAQRLVDRCVGQEI